MLVLLCIGIGIGLLSWLCKPCPRTKSYQPKFPKIDLTQCQEKWKIALSTCPSTQKKYFILGCGSMGSRLIQALLQRGETKLRVMDIRSKQDVEQESWYSKVEYHQGNICDLPVVQTLCQGMDTIFLTASRIRYMDSLPYQYATSYDVNVKGVETVLQAAKAAKVKELIYTSSVHVNVPYEPYNTIELEETMPYVTKETALSHYAITKAMGEQLVLNANIPGKLHTIALRCGGIFGPYDQMIFQFMYDRKQYEFLGFHVFIDWVFVDNIVYAHLKAEQALPQCAGHTFGITNHEPMSNNAFRQMIAYYAPEIKLLHLPPRLFWGIAYGVELLQRLLKECTPSLGELNYLTPTTLRTLLVNFYMNPTKATKQLQYEPVFTVDEGIQLSIMERKLGSSIYT